MAELDSDDEYGPVMPASSRGPPMLQRSHIGRLGRSQDEVKQKLPKIVAMTNNWSGDK